jgi:hypothetical protein
MDPPDAFACPTGGAAFALLLVADAEVSPMDRAILSKQLVRAGCRHAVCFGPTSGAWEHAIDLASVADELDGRAGPFVMTSAFEGHPLDEAVRFFADCAAVDAVLGRFVALVLGGDPDLEREVERALLGRFR